MDNADLRVLKEAATSNFREKKIYPEIYYETGLAYSAGVCLAIIEKVNVDLIEESRQAEVAYFRYYLMVDVENLQLLDYIVELLETIEL